MLKRIIEDHQQEYSTGLENAQRYAEGAEKASKMRFRGFLKKLNALGIQGNYLEVGAGAGTLAADICESNKNIDVLALDVSPDMVTVANQIIKKKNLDSRIKCISGNIEDEEFASSLGKFDLVYTTFTLHHFEDPKRAVINMFGCLKDDGVLLIYDLKRVWWLYWVPKQSGFFNSIRAAFRPHEIKGLLNDIGINKYKVNVIFPYFMQNITIWKK